MPNAFQFFRTKTLSHNINCHVCLSSPFATSQVFRARIDSRTKNKKKKGKKEKRIFCHKDIPRIDEIFELFETWVFCCIRNALHSCQQQAAPALFANDAYTNFFQFYSALSPQTVQTFKLGTVNISSRGICVHFWVLPRCQNRKPHQWPQNPQNHLVNKFKRIISLFLSVSRFFLGWAVER